MSGQIPLPVSIPAGVPVTPDASVSSGAALAVAPGPVPAAAAPAKKTRAKRSPAGTGAAAAQITPELAADLEAKRAQYAGLLRIVQEAPSHTQEDCQNLVDTAADAKAHMDLLKTQRDSITKPLNAALTAARRLFNPPIEFLESVERAIKDKLNARLAEQRRLQAEALAQVQAGGGRASAETMALATGATLIATPEGAQERETWHAEVSDPTQLPAAYWIPNLDLLNDIAKREKGKAQVPGVRFYATRDLAISKAVIDTTGESA